MAQWATSDKLPSAFNQRFWILWCIAKIMEMTGIAWMLTITFLIDMSDKCGIQRTFSPSTILPISSIKYLTCSLIVRTDAVLVLSSLLTLLNVSFTDGRAILSCKKEDSALTNGASSYASFETSKLRFFLVYGNSFFVAFCWIIIETYCFQCTVHPPIV